MLVADEEFQDPNACDRDPPDMGPLHLTVPDGHGHDHLPKFDFDDGFWTVDVKMLSGRVSARRVMWVIWSSISQMLVLLLTCGATEQDLNYGFERYPLYTKKYGALGAGKYKHVMKVNRDDLYQPPMGQEDIVPENYRYAEGVPRSIIQTSERKKQLANRAAVAPGGGQEGGAAGEFRRPLLDPVVQLPVARKTSMGQLSEATAKREPATMETVGKERSIGGLKGIAEAHGRKRPVRKLKFFEEVRIIVYTNKEVLDHRKSAVWVSGEIINQNKKEHKMEKEKMNKLKKAEERQLKEEAEKAKKAERAGKSTTPTKNVDALPEMSLASRVKE